MKKSDIWAISPPDGEMLKLVTRFFENRADGMTLPAGLDTCVNPPTILVCKTSTSAVHEEVTEVAFHGHACLEIKQPFRQQTVLDGSCSSFS